MNLKEERLKNKMTQLDVSKALKISKNGYINWETGANEISEENLNKLKNIFGNEKNNINLLYEECIKIKTSKECIEIREDIIRNLEPSQILELINYSLKKHEEYWKY